MMDAMVTAGDEGRAPGARGARLGTSLSGTNLARAADYNQRVVLQVIRRHPGITRGEIATLTGLTGPTIANITGRLFDADLIRSSGRRHGLRGQPPVRLMVNADGCYGLGLNVDRDHITLVSLDLEGNVRTRTTRQIAFAMPDDVRAFVGEALADLAAAGTVVPQRILGVGVALPDELGRVPLPHRPAGYERWSDIDLRDLLADLFPWPLHIDNDAAAAAIGEAQFGSGNDHESFFYILISAGLGGGLVIDGAYYRGAQGRSGELGFLPLPGGAAAATLQDIVSLSALTDRLVRAGFAAGELDPTLALPDGSEAIVDAWVEDAATALLPALTAVSCLINPDAILVSGRLPDAILDRLARCVHDKLAALDPSIPAAAPVSRATLSRDAPAVGAAILPFLDRILPFDAILMK